MFTGAGEDHVQQPQRVRHPPRGRDRRRSPGTRTAAPNPGRAGAPGRGRRCTSAASYSGEKCVPTIVAVNSSHATNGCVSDPDRRAVDRAQDVRRGLPDGDSDRSASVTGAETHDHRRRDERRAACAGSCGPTAGTPRRCRSATAARRRSPPRPDDEPRRAPARPRVQPGTAPRPAARPQVRASRDDHERHQHQWLEGPRGEHPEHGRRRERDGVREQADVGRPSRPPRHAEPSAAHRLPRMARPDRTAAMRAERPFCA